MATNAKTCAYCGRLIHPAHTPRCESCRTRDHVIPANLYPLSKRTSRVQRLTVGSCDKCNNRFSADEAFFRNLLVCCDPCLAARELWQTIVVPSFDGKDGEKLRQELLSAVSPVTDQAGSGHVVFPGQHERVLFVVRKVVRGLCHHHELLTAVADERVNVQVFKTKDNDPARIIEDEIKGIQLQHRELDICRYGYLLSDSQDTHSAWALTFVDRVTFLAWVSSSP